MRSVFGWSSTKVLPVSSAGAGGEESEFGIEMVLAHEGEEPGGNAVADLEKLPVAGDEVVVPRAIDPDHLVPPLVVRLDDGLTFFVFVEDRVERVLGDLGFQKAGRVPGVDRGVTGPRFLVVSARPQELAQLPVQEAALVEVLGVVLNPVDAQDVFQGLGEGGLSDGVLGSGEGDGERERGDQHGF